MNGFITLVINVMTYVPCRVYIYINKWKSLISENKYMVGELVGCKMTLTALTMFAESQI